MIRRIENKEILKIKDFEPSDPRFEVIGAFNPGAVRFGDEIILLVRIAEAPIETREGFLGSPRREGDQYVIDWMKIVNPENCDHRKPLLEQGLRRLAFISHLALVRLDADGYKVKSIEQPKCLYGNHEYEEFGLEDPRITQIGDTYYITYVAVSRKMSVCTCLMSTKDFQKFERLGVIFPWENKDVVLLPEKIKDKFFAFHRPVGVINLRPLAMQTAMSPNLLHWGEHGPFLECRKTGWDSERIGAGAPPIRTERGWLQVYHGVEKKSGDDHVGIYRAGIAITSLENPGKLLHRSTIPIMEPEKDFEKIGFVNDVVFPTGIVRDKENIDRVHVYYGAADTSVAVVTFSLQELFESLGESHE